VIATLKGVLQSRGADSAVIEAAGVGYEVSLTEASALRLPALGCEVMLYIVESFGMYGGTTLYGFQSASEKEMFLAFRENVPGAGAKKALEYLEKASKSLPDFRRAVIDKDAKLLCGVFGFTKKTAERLIAALKDKIEKVEVAGVEKFAVVDGPPSGAFARTLEALQALGYKNREAMTVLEAVSSEASAENLSVEDLLRRALKKL
jgi:Holliday junction DNA helicase RuvA